MGIRSVRRGIRKWRANAPQMEGKGPKNFGNFFLEKSVVWSSFTPTWTVDPVVKPFGTTVKKELRNEVETSD